MKKILILILVLAMCISLFACSDPQAEDPTGDETVDVTESESEGKTEDENTDTDSETVTDPSESESADSETESNTISESETESDAQTDEVSESASETETATETSSDENTEETTEEITTEEEESEEMESNVQNDDLASVGKYEQYDLDSYMTPIWEGKVVHNETVMFVGIDDKAPLLYDADKIISVRSYDLKTEYVMGVDYDYVDGKLVLLEGTRIPYVPLETYYSVLDPEYPYLSTMYNGKVTQTMFGDGTTMTQWQVAVTYKHSDTWEGKVVESYEDRFADFIGKLEKGEDVTVFFYGDSITTGATSSQSRAPYAPSYPRMFVQYVAKQYGYTVKYVDTYSDFTSNRPSGGQAHPDTVFGTNGTITYLNTAVGGWSTQNGVDNFAEYVGKYIKEYGCDLFVLAFGMNNGGSSASTVATLLQQIARSLSKVAPETDLVLVSTMIPNPEAVKNPNDKYYCNGNQHTFEEAMYPLADLIQKNALDCAVAPMTSVSKYIHSQKRYRDTTGNNVNHPSDFLARTYAQVIYQTVFGYENYEKDPVDIGETPIVDVNYNAVINKAGKDLFIDLKGGTSNANDAVCVRLESAKDGYYLYFYEDNVKYYLNASSTDVVCQEDKKTVWTYDEASKSMVCGDSEVAVKLITPEICLHPTVLVGDGHVREACVRCGVEKESGAHAMNDLEIKNPDGSIEYVSTCALCGYVKSSYTVPEGINHYYPIGNISHYNGEDGGILEEDGVKYQRSLFKNGEGHIFVSGNNNTTPINGKTGNYLVIKYRASGDSSVRFDLCTSDHEGERSTVTRAAADMATSWETAVIALSQFANYTCDEDLKVQIRITIKTEYFDIAYVAIVDSLVKAKKLMTDETYVLYDDWSAAGVEGKVSEIPDKEPDNSLASVGVYDEFNIDSYMKPIWDGKVVHNETVMFVGKDDKAPLLYTADKIISVRSYDLSIEYVQGVDYDYVDGKLVLLEGTRIPYVPLETYYSVHNNMPYLSTMYNGKVTQTMFGEGNAMCKWQVAVTYKHTDEWKGVELESYEERFADLIKKLEKGEDVTFIFYGDSITAGGNSSEAVGMSPYTPIWARMFTQYVAKQYGYTVKYVDSYSDPTLNAGKPGGGGSYKDTVYGTNGTITYVNTAVGGWNTQQGRDNFDAYIKAYVEKYGCDLFVLAFGMNNGGSTASDVCGYLEEIVVKMEACAPDSDILLVSTMIPNPEAVRNSADKFFCNGNQPTFEASMIPLAEKINNRGTDCALAPMTSVTKYLHSIKRFRDTTGNNVNHPSDFVVRLYAQVLFETVFGYENFDDGIKEIEGEPQVDVNYNGKVTVSDQTLFIDGIGGTDNANNAVCVRLEACEGGHHLYFIKDGQVVYINQSEGALTFDATASSVWKYDTAKNAMVSGDTAAIELVTPEICLHPVIADVSGHGREACKRCGIESGISAHSLVESTTTLDDGSVSYKCSCSACGYVASNKTVASGVKYYSAAAIAKSPIFYQLGHTSGVDAGGAYTRVTAGSSNHGHELHFVDQNAAHHNDFSGKPLDTEGAQYVVIKLRACGEVTMQFQYNVLGNATASISLAKSALKAGEWVTFVIDLKAASADQYIPDANGTYVMHRFKIFFGTDFVGIKDGYVDFAYMSVCDDWDEVKAVADQDELMLVASSGSASAVTKDGECSGSHSAIESIEGNVYTSKCAACGVVLSSKTLPEGVKVYIPSGKINNNANSATLINYAEIINDEDGSYARIHGGEAHPTQNYNQFSLYSNSSASTVTGQYLVIKYRVGENGLGQKKITIYAGTANVGPTTEKERIDLYVGDGTTIEDDTWHTAIIDMSTTAGMSESESLFKASETDGLYRAKFVSVRPFFTGQAGGDESDYIDIAYAAICDNLEDAVALIEEDSYEYYSNSAYPEIKNITE